MQTFAAAWLRRAPRRQGRTPAPRAGKSGRDNGPKARNRVCPRPRKRRGASPPPSLRRQYSAPTLVVSSTHLTIPDHDVIQMYRHVTHAS